MLSKIKIRTKDWMYNQYLNDYVALGLDVLTGIMIIVVLTVAFLRMVAYGIIPL